jgi:hypothetical protein
MQQRLDAEEETNLHVASPTSYAHSRAREKPE